LLIVSAEVGDIDYLIRDIIFFNDKYNINSGRRNMGKLIVNNRQQMKKDWANMGDLEKTLAVIQIIGIICTIICLVNLYAGFFHKALLVPAIALYLSPMIAGSNIEERS